MQPITNDSDCQLASKHAIVCIFEQVWLGEFPFNLRHAVYFQRTCRDFRDSTQDYLKQHNFYYPRISSCIRNSSLTIVLTTLHNITQAQFKYDKNSHENILIKQYMNYDWKTGPMPTLIHIKGDAHHHALLIQTRVMTSVFCLGGQLTANTTGDIVDWYRMSTTQVVDWSSGPLCYLEPSLIVPVYMNSRQVKYEPALRIQIPLAGVVASNLPPHIDFDTMQLFMSK